MKIIFSKFVRLTVIILFVTAAAPYAQRNLNETETVFDFIQMKRSAARQLWNKEKPSVRDLESAISLLKEILAYLDKPEARALEEIDQSLKSQRADVRYELAKALIKAERRNEAFEMLDRLADEAGSSIYADWMQGEPDKILFAGVAGEPEVKRAISRLRSLEKFYKSPALKTPYRENISEDEKITGLSLFWSTAKYSFVYFDRVPELDWDSVYLEYLPKVRRARSTYEYYRLLQQMCALLKDGHTNVYLPKDLQEKMAARPPLATILAENKVIVEGVYSEALRRQGIRVGHEIVGINGIPVREYAEKTIKPYQSSSTEQDLNVRTYSYALLAGAKEKSVELTFKNESGKLYKLVIARSGYTDFTDPTPSPFEFKVMNGNFGYIALNSFGSEQIVRDFVENFDALAKTDALIIDLRANGGGNSDYGDLILSYLTDKPFQTARWDSRQYRALRRAYGVDIEWFGENAPVIDPHPGKFFSKPIAVLIGSRTFSAAEDFVVAFDYMKRGLLVGEPTAGSTGQPVNFALPGGGRARICVKRDAYPDGKKFVGVGITPDVPVSPKESDIASGRDTVLETALIELKKKLKP